MNTRSGPGWNSFLSKMIRTWWLSAGVRCDLMHNTLIQQSAVPQVTSHSDQLSSIIKLRSKSDQVTTTGYCLSCSQVCYNIAETILLSLLETGIREALLTCRGTSLSFPVNRVCCSLQKFARVVKLTSFWGHSSGVTRMKDVPWLTRLCLPILARVLPRVMSSVGLLEVST